MSEDTFEVPDLDQIVRRRAKAEADRKRKEREAREIQSRGEIMMMLNRDLGPDEQMALSRRLSPSGNQWTLYWHGVLYIIGREASKYGKYLYLQADGSDYRQSFDTGLELLDHLAELP